VEVVAGAGDFTSPGNAPNHYAEHLRTADLSLGTYSVPAGGLDDQSRHSEDEVYVVTAGSATLRAGGESAAVEPGSVIYVPAGEEHRFTDVSADLSLVVVFA
jgi:mannose-6-phosphate isomerase-like protein (cupin superfamily)